MTLTLNDINKAICEIKCSGVQPSKIIVGLIQYEELSKLFAESDLTFIQTAESNKNMILGLDLIKLNNINNYFEVQ